MGDEMFSRFKTLAISAAAVAAVLSVLVLAKYFNAPLLAFARKQGGQYLSYLKGIALVAFLFLLLLWRALLLRRSQD
jgi:hypothetical protein